MKKLFVLILSGMLLLTSCDNSKKGGYVSGVTDPGNGTDPTLSANASAGDLVIGEETVRLSWCNLNLNLNSEFFRDDIQDYTQEKTDRLNFIDFDSMISTVVCPKPNCTRTDSSACSSFGMTNHATAIGNKIYYLNAELFPQFFDIIAYRDGYYIYRDSFKDFPDYKYAKISEDEIFKE